MSKQQYGVLLVVATVAGLVGCDPAFLLPPRDRARENCVSRALSYGQRTDVHNAKLEVIKARGQLWDQASEKLLSSLTKVQDQLRQQSVAGIEGAGLAYVRSLSPEQVKQGGALLQEAIEMDQETDRLNQEAVQLLQEKA